MVRQKTTIMSLCRQLRDSLTVQMNAATSQSAASHASLALASTGVLRIAIRPWKMWTARFPLQSGTLQGMIKGDWCVGQKSNNDDDAVMRKPEFLGAIAKSSYLLSEAMTSMELCSHQRVSCGSSNTNDIWEKSWRANHPEGHRHCFGYT